MQGFSKDRSPDKLTDCEDGFGFLVWQFGVFLKSLVYKEVLFKLHCFPVKTGFPGGGGTQGSTAQPRYLPTESVNETPCYVSFSNLYLPVFGQFGGNVCFI